MKSHPGKVDFNNFGFFHKLFVNNKFKPFNIKGIICIFWLVQSHSKRWAASATGIEKNSYGSRFFPLKIVIDLRFGRICQVNHFITLLIGYLFRCIIPECFNSNHVLSSCQCYQSCFSLNFTLSPQNDCQAWSDYYTIPAR